MSEQQTVQDTVDPLGPSGTAPVLHLQNKHQTVTLKSLHTLFTTHWHTFVRGLFWSRSEQYEWHRPEISECDIHHIYMNISFSSIQILMWEIEFINDLAPFPQEAVCLDWIVAITKVWKKFWYIRYTDMSIWVTLYTSPSGRVDLTILLWHRNKAVNEFNVKRIRLWSNIHWSKLGQLN